MTLRISVSSLAGTAKAAKGCEKVSWVNTDETLRWRQYSPSPLLWPRPGDFRSEARHSDSWPCGTEVLFGHYEVWAGCRAAVLWYYGYGCAIVGGESFSGPAGLTMAFRMGYLVCADATQSHIQSSLASLYCCCDGPTLQLRLKGEKYSSRRYERYSEGQRAYCIGLH